MKITDDKIEFTTDDFAGFSEPVKRALSRYLEDYAAHFSAKVNREIELAKGHLVSLTETDPRINSILTGLASADEEKLKEAEPLLVKLNELLNP